MEFKLANWGDHIDFTGICRSTSETEDQVQIYFNLSELEKSAAKKAATQSKGTKAKPVFKFRPLISSAK